MNNMASMESMSHAATAPKPRVPDPRLPTDAIDFSQVRRALVIKLRHHGDVLLAAPVFESLAAAAPGIVIDALVYRETLPLIVHNPYLAVAHSIDHGWRAQGSLARARHEWRLLRALQARRYDLVIHLTEHARGAWLTRLLRPRWSVAPRLRVARWWWPGSFTHLYASIMAVHVGTALTRRHTVLQNLDALRRLGWTRDEAPRLRLVPGADAERDADELLERRGVRADYVLMQPTSRWFFKCLPAAHNAQIIQALVARGETVLLCCAPDPREHAMIDAILAELRARMGELPPQLILATEAGTLGRLAALIGRARLFVGIDSAPMHIAAAMGTPVVAVFGPSSELTWGPWRVEHEVVTHNDYACRPCNQDGCGGGKISDCLTHLPVQRVMAAVDALQARLAHPSGASRPVIRLEVARAEEHND